MSISDGMWVLRGVAVAAGALPWALVVHMLAQVPPVPPARLGERGRRRAEWVSQHAFAPHLDACVRSVAGLCAGRLPSRWHGALARRLVLAGEPWGFGPEQLVGASVLCGLCAVAVALGLRGQVGPLTLLALVVLGPGVPFFRLGEERRARVKAVERSLPMAMDLVALCVRAGSDFPAALRFVVRELRAAHPVCTHELSRIEEAMALGRTRVDALRAFADRLDSAPVSRFVASLVQSERRGIPLADALATQAEGLRRLRSVRAEESAAKAGVRMVVPLMLMLASILALLLGPIALEGSQW